MTKLTIQQIREIAKNNDLEYAALQAFRSVESDGSSFDQKTGKIIIQFEPSHFRKRAPKEYAEYLRIDKLISDNKKPSDAELKLHSNWKAILANGVQGQYYESIAFNLAFSINPNAAMESTSIGSGQIMGFHFARLGYKTVGEMWDDAKRGEYQQLLQMVRFIKTDPNLFKALKNKNWHLVAGYYNGFGYKELAKRLKREPYNISMEKAYKRFLD